MTDQNNPGVENPQNAANPVQGVAPAVTATAPVKAGWLATRIAAAKTFFAPKPKKARAVSQSSTALAHVPTHQELVTQVEQVAISSNMPLETIVAMLSGETQDVKEVIDSFEDDKETMIGTLVGRIVTVICYVLPWIISVYAGSALGQKYSGSPFVWNDATIAYYYIVSWGYEFALVALMAALVRVFKRMVNGTSRRAGAVMIAVLALFILLATTSAAAQWILFEKNINLSDTSQVVGALFRTLATPLIDLVGATVLAVLHVKSLDQAIGTIQKKTEATININKKKIEAKLQTVSQAMEVKNMLQKEEDYAKKNELANTIIEMFSTNAIEAIRDNLDGKRGNGGGNQSRW